MDKQRFLKGGILLSLVALLGRGVGLFYSSFLGEHVGAEGIGLFTLVMNVYAFAVTFCSAGVSLATTNLVAAAPEEDEGARRRVLRTATTYASALSFFATLILLLLADALAVGVLHDARAALSIRILSLSLPAIALSAAYQGYFVGIRRVRNNAIVQIALQGMKIALTVLLFSLYHSLSVEAAAAMLSFLSVVCDVTCVLLLSLLVGRRGDAMGRTPMASAFLSITLPVALSAYVRQALLTLEHLLIPVRLMEYGNTRAEALSQYGVLHGMALPVLLFPMAILTSFSGLLVPEFARAKAEGARAFMTRIAERALSVTLVFGIAIGALLYLFSEELGYLFYRSAEAGRYIGVLAVVVPLMYLDHVTDSVLKGMGEQVYSMWVNITDSLLSVLLVVILLPQFGILGYAVVIIVMEGYNFLLSFLRLRTCIPVRVRLVRDGALPLLCAVVSAVLTRSLFSLNGTTAPTVFLLLAIVFCLCVFTFLLVVSRLLYSRRWERPLAPRLV